MGYQNTLADIVDFACGLEEMDNAETIKHFVHAESFVHTLARRPRTTVVGHGGVMAPDAACRNGTH